MKIDITNRDDIYLLVTSFYKKVVQDEILSPFFDKIEDWEAHYDQLTTFWESSLFLKTKYLGDPLAAHVKVDKDHNHSIRDVHFGLWLNLWFQTIDELFEGDVANRAKNRARKMSTFLYLKIFEMRST